MDARHEKQGSSTILYDAGCGCIIAMLFGGAVLGVVGNRIGIIPPILYDLGGRYLIPIFVGVVFLGIVADYSWDYLILSSALRWQKISIVRRTRFIYIAVMGSVGLLIDWLYYELTWGFLVNSNLAVQAMSKGSALNPGLELSTILVPIVLIGVANYLASRFHLHLDSKRALVVGLAMAVFTAPWLIVAFVLSRG
jgi:hypothetical protein